MHANNGFGQSSRLTGLGTHTWFKWSRRKKRKWKTCRFICIYIIIAVLNNNIVRFSIVQSYFKANYHMHFLFIYFIKCKHTEHSETICFIKLKSSSSFIWINLIYTAAICALVSMNYSVTFIMNGLSRPPLIRVCLGCWFWGTTSTASPAVVLIYKICKFSVPGLLLLFFYYNNFTALMLEDAHF